MIKGKNINLRLIKQTDLEEIVSYANDLTQKGEYLNMRLMNEVEYKKQFQETGLWNDDFGAMVITDKEGRLLGDISYFKGVRYMPGYEIGYNIYKQEQRGKGYTSEALRLFSAYLFETKQINRLEIHASPGNIGSCKVAEKAGFQLEGTKRQACWVRGKYLDLNSYSLLREDCPSFSEMIKE